MKAKLLVAAMLAVLSGSAMAQAKTQSFSISGNLIKPSGSDATGIVLASYGFMPTESIEVGLSVGAFFVPDADTETLVGVDAKYYFGAVGVAGSLVPYLKANVQHIASTTMYGAGGGIDYALTESASVFVEAIVQKSTGDESDSGNTSMIKVGLAYRF
jgi:opacity protein-like surface antigen